MDLYVISWRIKEARYKINIAMIPIAEIVVKLMFVTLLISIYIFSMYKPCLTMAVNDFWRKFGSAPSVFPSDVEYAIFDPCTLLPEDSFRNKFLKTMGLPFGLKTKFFFQILNDECPAGNSIYSHSMEVTAIPVWL